MSSLVRSTYLVTMLIGQLIVLAGAIAVPVWVTPGHYGWTAFLLFIFMCSDWSLTKRMNLWEGEA